MATRLFNGLILVVVGAVLLMNTSGYLPWSVWESALRYWPVLLVGLGLQVAAGRRFPGLALAVVAIMILAAMNPYAESWLGFEDSKHWSVELKPTTSRLEMSLEAPSLEVDVKGDSKLNASQPGLAVSVDLTWDRVEPSTTHDAGSETLRASIKSRANGNQAGRQSWNLALNPSLATSLNVSGGVSNLRIDMTSVCIDTLNVSSGVAKMDLTFGLSGRDTWVNVTGGVGNVSLDVPAAAGVKITLTGPLSLISDFSKQGLTKTGNYWATPGFDAATTKVILYMTCGPGKVELTR